MGRGVVVFDPDPGLGSLIGTLLEQRAIGWRVRESDLGIFVVVVAIVWLLSWFGGKRVWLRARFLSRWPGVIWVLFGGF